MSNKEDESHLQPSLLLSNILTPIVIFESLDFCNVLRLAVVIRRRPELIGSGTRRSTHSSSSLGFVSRGNNAIFRFWIGSPINL